MIEVSKNLFVGNILDGKNINPEDGFAIVHATKTCHKAELGYAHSLSNTHPYYLVLELGTDLFLNMVDMDKPLMPVYTNPIMKAAFIFIQKQLADNKKVLVHCDQGNSRAPSVAMLFMAASGKLPAVSYDKCKETFLVLYPNFSPGRGIEAYMKQNFMAIVKFLKPEVA